MGSRVGGRAEVHGFIECETSARHLHGGNKWAHRSERQFWSLVEKEIYIWARDGDLGVSHKHVVLNALRLDGLPEVEWG